MSFGGFGGCAKAVERPGRRRQNPLWLGRDHGFEPGPSTSAMSGTKRRRRIIADIISL